jgi:hypothetical protein
MKEFLYEEGYGPAIDVPPTIVISARPQSGEETQELIRIDRENPRVMILCYGGKCEKPKVS